MDYNSGYSRKMHVRCFLMVFAVIIHGVGFAQLVGDTIGSNLVSETFQKGGQVAKKTMLKSKSILI